MARKKNRHLNIAHKRAKRKQDGKSRQRQIALRKQRILQSAKSDEEQLQDRIMNSGLLVNEPEFENISFDTNLLRQNIRELLFSCSPNVEQNEDDAELTQEGDPLEAISEEFRNEALPCLITPNFLQQISQTLKACETRLKRIGASEKAEIAFVTRLFFDLAEPDSLSLHPLILKICIRTLEGMSIQFQLEGDEREVVQSVLSDLLTFSQGEAVQDHQSSTAHEEDSDSLDNGCQQSSDLADDSVDGEEPAYSPLTPPPEELPAKALYKNFDWRKVRQTIEMGDGYRLVADAEQQVEFAHTTQQRYITLTAGRLLLQCPLKSQLEVAMREIEQLCGQSVCYLARILDE